MEQQTIRPTWMASLIQSEQTLFDRLRSLNRSEARGAVSLFTHQLQAPRGDEERRVLRGVLLEVAVHCTATLHADLHHGSARGCDLGSEVLLGEIARCRPEAAVASFEHWQRAFWRALEHSHPPTLASSVGALVTREYRQRWSLSRLAHHFSTTPSRIRKAFEKRFGRSVLEHQRMARVLASLEAVRSQKVDAVALDVGYRSRKNYYRAFRKLMGTTLREYRTLPEERASSIRDSVSRRLTRGVRTPVP
jgi:methylphosphotriester-DNA--protein-cysteine methyltransferase